MKYVKILFAIALVFTMCSAFSLKKDHSKPVLCFWNFCFIYGYGSLFHGYSDIR